MPLPNIQEQKTIYELFRLSVLLKGAVSFLEIIAGLLVCVIPLNWLTNLLVSFAQGELSEPATQFLAPHVLTLAHSLATTSQTFIALYLLSRGFIKFVLIVALLRGKLWAYPSSLVVLGLFVAYQCYQLTLGLSLFLALLTIFDLVVMYFIWREYTIVRELAAHKKS